jgi:DNA polymerase-3 subunit alpha
MAYSGYFLIVKDFIDYARSINVRVGPGRGSATGSLVSYCLGIVNIDPIKYGLLFERFLNPERISLPDIDIDFADRGRDKVIDYVIKKYGEKNVCQIITFGTMAARQSLRDVGRVMQVPYGEVDRIAKLIPGGPGQTIAAALKSDGELKKLYEEDQVARRLIDQSQTLEGLARHASTHAAGVVIAPKELTEFVPLFKPPKGDEITTQYDMKSIEDIGLLKMDFLGLRTLTVIDDALDLIKQDHGVELDLDSIPLDDPAVYALFCGGHTVGIFQFESSGMRDYMRKLCPENLGDLIAMNALYRPGPLDAGTIDDYIKRKRGDEQVTYIHPRLEPILRETYGVIVYQEQVIKIAMELAGYSAGEGDLLRKAMGKKVREIMDKQELTFLEKCSAKSIDADIASKVFEQIETFARYGFNKSHAAGYSYLAYQTAYLKAHFPREFMAASLTSEMNSTDRIIILLEECRRLGMTVLPPDVNHSRAEFTVEDDKIRFGLGAVKNVGLGAIEKIVEARESEGPFRSLFDFTARVDHRALNKRALDALIRAGAADALGGHRAQLMENLDQAISYGQARQAGRAGTNQVSLFGGSLTGVAVVEPVLKPAARWDNAVVLRSEKELLGCWVSGHPLEVFRTALSTSASCTTDTLDDLPDGAAVVLGGIVTRIKINVDKKGKRMAFVSLEDFSGAVELVVFSDLYERKNSIIKLESMVMVSGKISKKEDEKPKIVLDNAELLEKVAEGGGLVLKLQLDGPGFNGGRIEGIERILADCRGSADVVLVLNTGGEQVVIRAGGLKAAATPEVTRRLAQLLGPDKIKWETRAGGTSTGTDA